MSTQPTTLLPREIEIPERIGLAEVSSMSVGSVLTPATGFISAYRFTLNPYAGCSFACDYCYARFFAPSPVLRDGWGSWVRVKENAAETIRSAKSAHEPERRLRQGDSIFMSSATDPYQPLEARIGLTRGILEALLPFQPRLTVQTRSPIVHRDIDLLGQFAAVRVNFSVPTDSESVRLRYEPHAPAISQRLATAQALREAGIPIGISISPMLPIQDPLTFGRRLAELDADEYLATAFHRPGPQYGARTRMETLEKVREDGWTRTRYEAARAQIQEGLGAGRQLLTGRQGFAPPKYVDVGSMERGHEDVR